MDRPSKDARGRGLYAALDRMRVTQPLYGEILTSDALTSVDGVTGGLGAVAPREPGAGPAVHDPLRDAAPQRAQSMRLLPLVRVGAVPDGGARKTVEEPPATARDEPRAPTPVAPVGTTVPAADPPASTPAPKHPAQSPLFRAAALAAYGRGERAASVLRIAGVSHATLLLALAFVLLLGAAVTALGSVEETTAARGVLRAAFGVQPVVASIAGTVRQVTVSTGARVAAGQVIAQLDATPLEAELHMAEQQLAAAAEAWRITRGALERNHARGAQLLVSRIALLERRRRSQMQRVARRDAHAARVGTPELVAVVEDAVREERREAAATARDGLLQLLEELSTLRLRATTEESEHQLRIAAGEQRVSEARTRRDSVRILLDQTVLRAPIAGRLESLRVQPGQVVQAAEWIARVVRDDTPRAITAFVPERDAAFLRAGAKGSVEIDQLPAGEFGHAVAKVTRVAGELADRSELTAALGEDSAPRGPHVRVELELQQDAASAKIWPYLRPGTWVTARIALRERRLLAIAFEPARRWLR